MGTGRQACRGWLRTCDAMRGGTGSWPAIDGFVELAKAHRMGSLGHMVVKLAVACGVELMVLATKRVVTTKSPAILINPHNIF